MLSIEKYLFKIILLICLVISGCEVDNTELDVVAFGDSHIAKWDFNNYLQPYRVLNNGVNGLLTEEVVDRAIAYDGSAKILFIHAGTNDHIAANSFGTSESLLIERVMTQIERLQSIDDHYDKIILLGSLPHAETLQTSVNAYGLVGLNDSMQSFCQQRERFCYVDPKAIFSDTGFLDQQYHYDHIHLNETAYAYLSKNIYEELD